MLDILCEGAQADLHHEQRKRLLKDMNKQMDSKLRKIKEYKLAKKAAQMEKDAVDCKDLMSGIMLRD